MGFASALPILPCSVEVSYIEPYEGQALHGEMERRLEHAGYRPDGRFTLHRHRGEPVQADRLFRRTPTLGTAPP